MTNSTMEIMLNVMIEAMREVGITDEQFTKIDKLVADKLEVISDERSNTKP